MKNLGRIKTVYPTAYKFRQEKGLPCFGGKKSGYQLTLEAILEHPQNGDKLRYFTYLINSCHFYYFFSQMVLIVYAYALLISPFSSSVVTGNIKMPQMTTL